MSKKKLYTIIGLIVVVFTLVLVSGLFGKKKGLEFEGPTFEVARGPLTISFVESGTIKARDQIIIKNELEGRTSIISLVPEGTKVEKGELLVELDASTLEDSRIDQDIRVQNTEAAYVGAKEKLAVSENQAKSDIDLAELELEFAKHDLDKYLNGEYPYELDKAEADITYAQEELAQARETLKWSNQLYEDKYISQTELQKDELAEKKKALDVQLTEKSKDLLTQYTYKRTLVQLKSDVSQAEMALERTRRKAKADVIQANADLKAKEAEYLRQKDKLQKILDQLEKTKIYAPADGLVIYATSANNSSWRGNSEPLEEGYQVREREELIYLPTGNSANAEISIHESNLKKTRIGQPAVINIDALHGSTFYGTVNKIAPLPDAQSFWMNPDLKVYKTEIYIDGENENLRTGMNCQAEIIIEQYPDALYVPIQAVMLVGNQPTVYVVEGNTFKPREVTTGLDNNKMIHIIEGLKEGDIVLLNPPLKSAAVTNKKHDFEKETETKDKIDQKLNDLKSKSEDKEPQAEQAKEDLSATIENLDPEKKEQLKKHLENLTPEQREKLKERFKNKSIK